MKCPHCPDATLLMHAREDVELDKLIERSATAPAPQAASRPPAGRPDFADSGFGQHRRGRHKSWLAEIFD